MNNQKSINSIFFYVALLAFILAILILIILFATFYNEYKGVHIEIWAKNYASLISALGIILASGLASLSVQRTIINSIEIEEKKKRDTILKQTSHLMFLLININRDLVYYEQILHKLKATYHTSDGVELKSEVIGLLSELNDVVASDYDLLSRVEIPNGMDEVKLNELLEVLLFVKSNLREIKAMIRLVNTIKVSMENTYNRLTETLKSTSDKIDSISQHAEKR